MIEFFKQNFGATITIFIFGALVAAVLATTMTKSAVCLKNKAKLSDGVVGGILLGIITSIPELITSIEVVTKYAKDPGNEACGIFGDAIGSDMFCLFILGIVLLACVVIFVKREVNQINTFSIAFVALGTVFCLIAGLFGDKDSPIVWHGFNLLSVFILFSYAASVYFMIFGSRIKPKAIVLKGSETQTISPKDQKPRRLWFDKLPLWGIIVLFILFAGLLIGCSVILGYSCESLIVDHWKLPSGFGRFLLLGTATSLPELIGLISLAMDKEYNMSIDSIIGSCGFNLTILFICNIIYAIAYNPNIGGQMFSIDIVTGGQMTLFLIEIVFMLLYFVANSQSVKQYLTKRQVISINSTLLTLVIVAYLVYIIVGFTAVN